MSEAILKLKGDFMQRVRSVLEHQEWVRKKKAETGLSEAPNKKREMVERERT